jgi:hypothetical protein
MAHVTHKPPISIGLGRRAGRRVWIAAAVALAGAGVLLVLLLAGGGEETSPLEESGGAPATLNRADGIRYDGGPDEGARGVVPVKTVETAPGPGLRTD